MKTIEAITTLTCRFNKLLNFFSPVLLIYVNFYFESRGSTLKFTLLVDAEALIAKL